MTNTNKGLDASLLLTAVRKARENHDGETKGLSATRRIYNGVSNREWIVAFDGDSGQFLTVLTNEDVLGLKDTEIVSMILDAWDKDWDDVLVERPVGDYSIGSSDFRQRNQTR